MKYEEKESTVFLPFPDKFKNIFSLTTTDGQKYINTNYSHPTETKLDKQCDQSGG